MSRLFLAFFLFFSSTLCFSQSSLGLTYQQNQSLTYSQVIKKYRQLSDTYANTLLVESGITDCGKPLHVFLIGNYLDPSLSLQELVQDKLVILINNGIHPGESAGIEASLKLAEAYLNTGISEEVLLAIIPVYNVGGALNRGAFHRANQNGPEEHGFRGNAQNLDLNRDFVKADALNTLSFFAVFQALQPHIFVDTHTSNGADYQYTMTLISTQKDKLNPVLSQLMTDKLEPYLYEEMKKKDWEMTPYVNVFGRVPNDGIASFLETPRYASGYTTLFNCIGFITETHMLKPYESRVEATFSFLQLLLNYAVSHSDEIKDAKNRAVETDRATNTFAINWELDSAVSQVINFKGYEYSYVDSEIGDYQRLKYHANKPVDISIPYYSSYRPTEFAAVPSHYVVPQAWRKVIQRLQYNQVKMMALPSDTTLEVQVSYIKNMKFSQRPYEGHFPLLDFTEEDTLISQKFFKGDYLISTDQDARRYLVAMLEPRAVDSYLRWNFFDPIFSQKEYFSAYVFEDTAKQLLEENEELKDQYQQWLANNPEKAQSSYQCLRFIYEHSPYYEKSHLLYPVGRIFND